MRLNGDRIDLDKKDIYNNFIQLEPDGEFELKYLNDQIRYNKGASSNIFILVASDEYEDDRVIKICKTSVHNTDNKSKKKLKRFRREIKAFEMLESNVLAKSGVINYYGAGEVEIDRDRFLYIVLEKAKYDLADYLKNNSFNFTNSQKFNFCVNIINSFSKLHGVGIYHRDIKHDNIFYTYSGEFKIGDLGLIEFRDEDSIDFNDEKIGPIGWLSPEATNKMLSSNKCNHSFDCEIDEKSDVFQLGKLFWYIFQGNLPIGHLDSSDSRFDDLEIFDILRSMLSHSKQNRPTALDVIDGFAPIKKRLVV
jgi:serine/threonine protein kinase